MRATTPVLLCVLVLDLAFFGWPLASGLASAAGDGPAAENALLFDGLGGHRRPVSTSSVDAQRNFDQGLAFLYAFNHDEAVRSFRQAARVDPECAMAWWGIALASGPHINNPVVSPEN